MYEDVCLQCGKPLVDSRAYCSDDCESLDATSPSISTASSTFPSPHLTFSMPASAAERDIPALLPSALGGSPLNVYTRYRKMNNPSSPYSRYRLSSTHPWSASPDADDDRQNDVGQEELGYHESGEKSPASISPFLTPVASSGLSYARRPSSTNHHSTVPLLHRRSSSGASSPTRSVGIPQSAPLPMALPPCSSSTDDEFSDTPEKDSTLRANPTNGTPAKATFKKRNRASLPAYFSLLQLTSTTLPPKKESKHTPVVSTSRSAPKFSPRTARIRDRGFSITAPSTSAVTPTTVLANQVTSTPRGRERGRSRRRGDGSSSSSAPRSRSRRNSLHVHLASPSRPTCQHHHLTQNARRINSVEKVADWVTSSIGHGCKRKLRSPFPGPSGRDGESADSEDEGSWEGERPGRVSGSDERRGRRRAHELDVAPSDARGAPGFGNGRSGIRDRERRGIGLGFTQGMSLGVLEGEKMDG